MAELLRSPAFAILILLSGLSGTLQRPTGPLLSVAQQAQADPRDFACAPRLQLRYPQRCSPFGPGARAAELARQGLFPPKPLPIVALEPELQFVPFEYVRAGSDGVRVYGSADDAGGRGGGQERIPPGFVYLSYYAREERDGMSVYATQRGYVRGDEVSRVTLPASPGLAFSRTPDRPFGWVISGGSCTSREPGGPVDPGGLCFTRHSVVQVYDVQRVGEWNWYKIGQDQWLEQRLLGIVDPDPSPPAGVTAGRWISVNLYEQTLAAYDQGELVFATVISSGRSGFWTQPGTFQVWAKLQKDDMSGGMPSDDGSNYYYLEDVPWVLYFDQARALHGTYWHSKFGTPTSRGCVNLAPHDAHWIFEFAEEGSWVYVWDPSGNTPTDPAAYGPGGA
jgi:hypothetical protein